MQASETYEEMRFCKMRASETYEEMRFCKMRASEAYEEMLFRKSARQWNAWGNVFSQGDR